LKEVVVALSSHYSTSGLDVWFKDDICNTLRAVDLANADVCKVINTPEMQFYRRGYEAALRAISEAFGVHYRATGESEERPTIIDVTPD
jgi:hypothetical protein